MKSKGSRKTVFALMQIDPFQSITHDPRLGTHDPRHDLEPTTHDLEPTTHDLEPTTHDLGRPTQTHDPRPTTNRHSLRMAAVIGFSFKERFLRFQLLFPDFYHFHHVIWRMKWAKTLKLNMNKICRPGPFRMTRPKFVFGNGSFVFRTIAIPRS